MSNTESNDLGFRVFRIAEAVYHTKSVSKAAYSLGLSQPAVSLALSRLRKRIGDPIFVKTKVGMVPTPRGEEILIAARKSLMILNEALSGQSRFSPSTTTRQYSIAINQITQMTLFPLILRRLSEDAPNATVIAIPISAETINSFGAGSLDLAIGDIADVQPGWIKKTVLTDDYVCIASKNHPRIIDNLTQEQFELEPHVIVSGVGSIMRAAEDWMRHNKIHRTVQVQLFDFLGLDRIIANSEMIATVPRTLGELFAYRREIKLLAHPCSLPKSASRIYWHERHNRDDSHQWFRQLVIDMLLKYGHRRKSDL